jgi:signal transduction histidine kinase
LLGVLLFARLWPGRITMFASVGAFTVLELIVGFSGQGVAGLTVLGILASCYGLMFLAVRLREANNEAAALLVALEQSQAAGARAAGLAERQRLAREMHDVLAHSPSGLLLQLQGARMLAADNPTDPRIPEAIDRADHLGETGLDDARRAIGMLRDDELPRPERLGELAAQFQDDRGISCQFEVSGEAGQLGSETRLALYRVAQEALTIEDLTSAAMVARPPQPGSSGGYGLTGMRERAELLGGTLTTEQTPQAHAISPEPASGRAAARSCVFVCLPVRAGSG